MRLDDLKPGDVLFHEPDGPIGNAIVAVTGGRFSHVGQVVRVRGKIMVANFEAPTSRYLTLDSWAAEYGPVLCGPLKRPLTLRQEIRLNEWWAAHMGQVYDYLLLFRLAGITWWQRLCLSLGWNRLAKIQPWTLSNVCSTAVATACKYAGLAVDETTGMTPADLEDQAILGPVVRVDVA